MKKKIEEKIVYQTAILRKNGEHISVLESTKFDDCLKCWESLQNQWADCAKEMKPFIIKDPVITAFEPGLIYEILVRPLYSEESANSNNPYTKRMYEQGLTRTLGGEDILNRVNPSVY